MAQYEMSLRDYWQILRKRKLAVILTCLSTAVLTFVLTQHVFRRPPTFQAVCDVSVRPEVVGLSTPRAVSVAQEAKDAKSESLLGKAIWAIEHYPLYEAGLLPEDDRGLHAALLRALELPTRRATTRDLACLFLRDSGTAQAIREKAALQEKAVSEASVVASEEERTAMLEEFPQGNFISGRNGGEEDERQEADETRDTIIVQLQASMVVEWDRTTSSFTITVMTTAPGFQDEDLQAGSAAAVHLAETIATVYKANAEWQGRRGINKELDRIDVEMAELRETRKELEKERRELLAEIEAKTAGGEYQEARLSWQGATDQLNSLERYQEQLGNYLAKRANLEANPEMADGYPPIPPPTGVDDVNIQGLYRESTKVEMEKNTKLGEYTPGSHVIAALDEKIARIAGQLTAVVSNSIENEKSRVEQAKERFSTAEANLPHEQRAEAAVKAQEISGCDIQLSALNDRRGRLSLFKEQSVQVDIIGRPGGAEQLGQASAAVKTALGGLIGLILGVVIAVLWETFDLTIGTIEEVESFLKTRVLGVVPHLETDRVAAEIRARHPESEADTTDAELQLRALLVTIYAPKSVSAESFRHIRTALDFARRQTKPGAKVMLVTSATLSEGKSAVAANLAVVFAQNGKRVCLVECDLRRPQMHHVLGISRSPGLHDVFIGKMSWQEAKKSFGDFLLGKIGMEIAVGVPGLENLTVLTCGTVPPNPVELLGSAEMKNLFAELRENFDVVIVDSPPILPVADASVISPLADGAILVYRAGAAPRTILSRAKTELESVGTQLFGVVLNDLRPAAGEISATYPYKGYARKPYAAPEEQGEAPRVPVETVDEAVVERAAENTEDQTVRKIDLLLLQGKVEQAVETAYDAARALPHSMTVRLELARTYTAAGRVGEAQAELLHVLEMDPRNLPALERLAEMALDAGLEREALRWFEEILEFDPQNAKACERADEIRANIENTGAQSA